MRLTPISMLLLTVANCVHHDGPIEIRSLEAIQTVKHGSNTHYHRPKGSFDQLLCQNASDELLSMGHVGTWMTPRMTGRELTSQLHQAHLIILVAVIKHDPCELGGHI